VGARRWKWSAVSTVTILILAGCGGVPTKIQNPPPPATQAVAIDFQPTPPEAIGINGTASVTAVVKNDPSDAGVDWNLPCPGGVNCGSLRSAHTASGQAQTYTPPSTISSNSQSVTIVAFATVDHTKNALAAINVSAYGSILKGTYIVQTNGFDVNGLPYQRVGAVILDGNGGITSGEQTVNFLSPATGTLSSVSDAIIGGTYFIGGDGRGTLAINTADVNVGQLGTCAAGKNNIPCGIETFSLVVLSSSQVLLTKTDDQSLPPSNESSVGKMELQTSAAAPTGGYAFVTRGIDINFTGIGLGGVFNIDGPNAISGTGSVADLADNDGSGLVTFPSSPVSGTVSSPDSLGAVQISLTTGFPSPSIQFTGYVVDTTHMALIESDDAAGAGFGITAGVALAQGSATGTFTINKSFSGSYAFGIFGPDSSGGFLSFLSSAGIFTASGTGFLTKGYIDEFQFENSFDVQVSDGFHGTYTVDPAGTGRVDTNSSIKFSHTVNGTGPELVFYLTGKGTQAVVLDADILPALGGAGVGTGIAYPVTKGASFGGLYGLTSTQNFSGTEADSVGEITVDGTAQSVSGTLDMNEGFFPDLDSSLTDGFQTSVISGRLTGTWSDQFFPSTLSIAYYPIDAGHGWFVENDGGVNGTNPGNLTFGYYSTRSPVCQGCP